MNRHAAIELEWGDGEYTFRLGLSEIEELELRCDCGIFQIFDHFGEARTLRLHMISATLRLGLIGGGMAPVEALGLVRKYVDERPVDENRDTAFAVIMAALQRVHGDELIERVEDKKDKRGKKKGSTSPAFTAERAA